MKATMGVAINIGISEKDRKTVADDLSKLLADTYTLYLRTQNFHWNVTGPFFDNLHHMFEEQYKQLAEAADIIAERIGALGYPAPASYSEFTNLTSFKDEVRVQHHEAMIRSLIEGHETVMHTVRSIFPDVESAKDHVTVDLLTERLEEHEQTAWMLRNLISD